MRDEIARALGRARWPLVAASVAVGLFLILPLAVLVPTSWTNGQFLQFPPQGFSLQWYRSLLRDSSWTTPLRISVVLGVEVAAVSTAVGTCAALALVRVGGRTGRLLRSLCVAPLAMPYIAYAIGLYDVFAHLPSLGGSTVPLILGESVLAFPLSFLVVSGSAARIDPALRAAASTMGARWPTVVWRVELPLLRPAIAAAALFAFVFSFDEVVLSIFLLPPGTMTFPLQMYAASREAISPQLTAASTVVTVLALAVLGAGALVRGHGGRVRAAGAARIRPWVRATEPTLTGEAA